jgi:hypothetical protein
MDSIRFYRVGRRGVALGEFPKFGGKGVTHAFADRFVAICSFEERSDENEQIAIDYVISKAGNE